MQKFACKIKEILAVNALGFDDQFIEFFQTEQHLKQLSSLICALKQQSTTLLILSDISEPQQENSNENAEILTQASHDLAETQSIAVDDQVYNIDLDNKSLNDPIEHQLQASATISDEIIVIDELLSTSDMQQDPQEQQAQIEKKRAEITDVFSQQKNELKFQVNNARAGQLYRSNIQILSALPTEDIEYIAESFKFSSDIFYFDEATQTVQGEPQQAEEINFSFQYRVKHEIYTGQCRFNVIPDPKSLWKVIEPEAGQNFVKAHTDQLCIDLDYYQLIAASRRGRSHEHAGSFRDDDFSIVPIENSRWSVLAVADGAGSAEYSREGSRIAVEIVQKEFQRYLNDHNIDALNADIQLWQLDQPQDAETQRIANKLNQQFYHVYYEIYRSILMQLDRLAQELNVATKVFSTTLLVAVVYQHPEKNFISTFSVGDGAIAILSDDMVRIMNVADGGEYAGQTKFLDRSIHQELGSRVKIGCFKDLNAVLLMTDGISDPIFETDAGLANQQKWLDLYADLVPIFQQEQPEQALLDWMHFFKTGHHDDRTLAALWKKNSST